MEINLLDQAKNTLRLRRNQLLAETDWIVTKYLEQGEPLPQVWKDYRQALRDMPNTATIELDRFDLLNEKILVWPTKPLTE